MEISAGPEEWKKYELLSPLEKGKVLKGSPHTLVAQQFVRKDLEHLCSLATEIRRLSKSYDGSHFLKNLL